jgi:poly-beta-1,6-N-acetyl-D-glucosamine synthase
MKLLRVGVGIFAHNEEINIDGAIRSVVESELDEGILESIIVVSSGSSDLTNKKVRTWMKRDERIKVLTEPVRQGKTSAINLFMRQSSAEVLVSMSADLKLKKNTLARMLEPFADENVGMVGAHPVPTNTKASSIGGVVKLMWELHHQVSLLQPKCGEVVAFRNVIRKLPNESAVDEATIEVLLTLLGYHVVYAPEAIVHNKGPMTISEFLTQRRRVQAGHEWIRDTYNYTVSTQNPSKLVHALIAYVVHHPASLPVMAQLFGLEVLARLLGYIDYHLLGRNPYVWTMIKR